MPRVRKSNFIYRHIHLRYFFLLFFGAKEASRNNAHSAEFSLFNLHRFECFFAFEIKRMIRFLAFHKAASLFMFIHYKTVFEKKKYSYDSKEKNSARAYTVIKTMYIDWLKNNRTKVLTTWLWTCFNFCRSHFCIFSFLFLFDLLLFRLNLRYIGKAVNNKAIKKITTAKPAKWCDVRTT